MEGRPGNFFCNEGVVMRWPSLLRQRPVPSSAPDIAAIAAMGFAEGSRLATLTERARCAAILQSPLADHNRASAKVLAFATDMDPPTALRLLTELANLGEAQNRAGPAAEHYARAARTIIERKSNP